LIIKKTYTSFSRQEFIEYFCRRGVKKAEGIYLGEGWEVKIGNEKNKMIGSVCLKTVDLIINVEDAISKEFLDKLRINFLRGGG
jgi:hypothetical protein